jgi:hypothetical protein
MEKHNCAQVKGDKALAGSMVGVSRATLYAN